MEYGPDDIVLPFAISVLDPRPAAQSGMPRRQRIVRHPAQGWPEDRPGGYRTLDDILADAARRYGTASDLRVEEPTPAERHPELGARRSAPCW